MRNSISRSTIYVIIGIGLFLLAVSQLRQGGEDSNAAFVAHSNPFETLKGYRPGSEPAKDELLSTPAANGIDSFSRLPSGGEQAVESTTSVRDDVVDSVQDSAQFTNTFNETAGLPMVDAQNVDAPEVDFQEVDGQEIDGQEIDGQGIEIAKVEAAEMDRAFYDLDNAATELPAPVEINETFDVTADQSFESFEMAITEETDALPKTEPTPLAAAPVAIKRESTNLPAFSGTIVSNSTMETKSTDAKATSVFGKSATQSHDETLQGVRWKTNPFIKEGMADSAATSTFDADAIAVDMLPPDVEALIESDFSETDGDLSMVTNIESLPQTTFNTITPTVDEGTMQSVIAADDNLELGSPAIKVGLSAADAQKAVHNIEYGKSLSRRGAAFAARQEFYSSLRILAQSHDRQVGGKAYTQALRNGIVALKEAKDFIVTDTETQIGLDVANVIETHSTKIISPESARSMTAIEAVQRYFAYASHQLSRSGGQNVVAAEALYCLGKLHSVQANNNSDQSKLDLAKSLVYHQAAIAADPSNYRSLNELGVLYANSGRFEESKAMLKKSLRIKQLPQAWQNLSVIHQRMGEDQLAQLADREFQMVSENSTGSAIRWTAVEEFNANAPLMQRTASSANNTLTNPTNTESSQSGLKSLGGRILNSIR